MKQIICFFAVIATVALTGCAGNSKLYKTTGGKNINADGFLYLGKVETTNPESGTPQGEFIVGRLTYKSRRVAIPADQKVPTTGYFKSTETTSLFGTKEKIIEYDFTAGSDAEAARAFEEFERRKNEAAATGGEEKK